MSRITSWTVVIYALAITGIATYEYATIQHLQFIIQLLTNGQSG